MKTAIGETGRRRTLQAVYNEANGITPESVVRHIDEVLSSVYERDYSAPAVREPRDVFRTQAELDAEIARLEDRDEIRSGQSGLRARGGGARPASGACAVANLG